MYTPLGVSYPREIPQKAVIGPRRPFVTSQKPINPRSANPIGWEEYMTLSLKSGLLMATPPKRPKNDAGEAFSRPFQFLIETGKSHPKTGLFPAVFGRFARQFSRRLANGSTSGFPTVLLAVFQRFYRGFSSGSTPVSRRFSGSFASGLPAVFQRFCRGFSNGSLATRFPWINSQPAPASSFIRKNRRQFRTQFHAYKPSIAHFRKCVRDKGTCQIQPIRYTFTNV